MSLPIINVDKQRRNFPGYSKTVLTEADQEEVMEGGTTETDYSDNQERKEEKAERE